MIIAKKGDYLLMVKGNQPKLLEAIEIAFIDLHDVKSVDRSALVERGHGRTVGQIASVLSAKGIINPGDWPNCVTIGRIDSMRVVDEKESDLERCYYITSRALTAEQLAASVRARWGVENRFHWILDVSFSEDASTVAKDNAPQNLSMLRKIALNIIRADKTDTRKSSLRLKRKGAARDDGVREPHAGRDQIDMLGECGGPALQPSWSSVASIVYITRQSTP